MRRAVGHRSLPPLPMRGIRIAVVRLFVLILLAGGFSMPVSDSDGPNGLASDELIAHAEAEGRACGAEDDEAASVLCGGDLLAQFVDPARLVMKRAACSRLLDELFATQTCSLSAGECGQVRPCAPPPVQNMMAASAFWKAVGSFGQPFW